MKKNQMRAKTMLISVSRKAMGNDKKVSSFTLLKNGLYDK